ncbi:MAG: transketolase, partial [Muribaculaceae bacterium]|nr:transketolase [Muribaculaceae bacterium]
GAVAADGSSKENLCSTHGQPLSKAGVDVAATITGLGGNPDDPFTIFEEARQLYAQREAELRTIVAARRKAHRQWADAHPDQARLLESWIAGRIPDIDYASIPLRTNAATRTASYDFLAYLSTHIGNLIVSSADLANSDKTDGFLKGSHAIVKGDFTGGFIHAGVSELTMASIMNGIALHGGLMAACGTFFVFSDYMKPAVRMSALMELPVKYVWSHDSFRVGEDGPTHEPIEQEAQLRLLEEIRNFSGRPSLLAMRPADSAECLVCWDMAMHNDATPSALVLSRQDLHDLPSASGDRRADAEQARCGGYAVIAPERADVVLVANGSEVSLLCTVAQMLEADGIAARVVSV